MHACMASCKVAFYRIGKLRGFQFEYLDHCYSNRAITDCFYWKTSIYRYFLSTVSYHDTYLLHRYIAIFDMYCKYICYELLLLHINCNMGTWYVCTPALKPGRVIRVIRVTFSPGHPGPTRFTNSNPDRIT